MRYNLLLLLLFGIAFSFNACAPKPVLNKYKPIEKIEVKKTESTQRQPINSNAENWR